MNDHIANMPGFGIVGRRVTINDSGNEKQYECVGVTRGGQAVLTFDGVMHPHYVSFHRLTVVPLRVIPEHPPGYKAPMPIAFNSDEALEWLAFVMLQAGSLFELIPAPEPDVSDDAMLDFLANDPYRAELIRIMTARGLSADGPHVTAALAYYDAALDWYINDRRKWEQE